MTFARVNLAGVVVAVCSSAWSAARGQVEGELVVPLPVDVDAAASRYDHAIGDWVASPAPDARQRRRQGRDWAQRRSLDIADTIAPGDQFAAITDFLFWLVDEPDIAARVPGPMRAGLDRLRADLTAIKRANPK